MRILEGEKHCLNQRSMRYIQYCVERLVGDCNIGTTMGRPRGIHPNKKQKLNDSIDIPVQSTIFIFKSFPSTPKVSTTSHLNNWVGAISTWKHHFPINCSQVSKRDTKQRGMGPYSNFSCCYLLSTKPLIYQLSFPFFWLQNL